MKKVELYDTTLRDGSQTEGISFSVNDKVRIAKKLDELGIHYIEGGWPGSNPKDKEFFKQMQKTHLKNALLVAFGSTRRAGIKASQDKNLKEIAGSKVKAVTIFGKTWDFHVTDVLKTSLEENLNMISDSISFLKSNGLKVFYDAEHFFDAYKANPEYALKTLAAAASSGAEVLILCDTNGGTLTDELVGIIEEVKARIKAPLGIHTHNDLDLAVANSIAAVDSGCIQVQGTFNGLGERCGNANLCTIIGILATKMDMESIPKSKLKDLTQVSYFISEISNVKHDDNQPFVGHSAFAHKAGVHIDAMIKDPKSYEHIDPHLVGNRRRFLVSELAGKTPIVLKAKEMELELDKKSPKAKKFLKLLQDLEHKGYQFEAADGSFEILMKKAFKKYKKFFDLEGFKVMVEKRKDDRVFSEATIRLKVKNKEHYSAAEGDGPVNALDNALRKALKEFYPNLMNMHLSDFKVRVLDAEAGTAAKVRVLIESQDETDSWTTVGVHENIIEASWQALVDSVEYKLLKDQSPKR
ncbi:MAG: citramalate synthase [Candidatus Omnitrophica bacterium]|nr:citramalate synthase [Candidatus Omnitrophota bacterium]